MLEQPPYPECVGSLTLLTFPLLPLALPYSRASDTFPFALSPVLATGLEAQRIGALDSARRGCNCIRAFSPVVK